jgi:hypothetical protein
LENYYKHRKVIKYLIAASFLTLISFLCACNESTSRYEVIDSGIWPRDESQCVWLDNHRVAFVSAIDLNHSKPKSLTVWDVDTHKVVKHGEVALLVCGRNGTIMVMKDGKRQPLPSYYRGDIYRGMVDNLQEHPEQKPFSKIDSVFHCDWSEKSGGPIPTKYPHRYGLMDENYMEFIGPWSESSQGEMAYHENSTTQPILMPFYLRDPYMLVYSEYKDIYVIYPIMNWPNRLKYKSLWLLQRSGKVEEVSLPFDRFGYPKGMMQYYLLKSGILLHSMGEGKSAKDPGNDGIYFIKGNSINPVLHGLIEKIVISPDGCRAAFMHANNSSEYISRNKPFRTIKAINFCK